MPTKIKGREVFQASEASLDDEGNQWITIIKEGVSINNRNYKKSALEKAVEDGVYEGARMFVDHSDGPPLKRGIRELVSGIENVVLDTSFADGKARVRGQVNWFDDGFKEFVDKAQKHIGVSHDALLRGTRSTKNGRRYEDIDAITKAHSVDWVVYPSAGGGFEFGVKEGVEMPDAIDWDAIDEDMLKKHKPDLYDALTKRRSQESEDDDEDEDEDEDESAQEAVKVKGKKSKKSKKGLINLRGLESQIESMVSRAVENVQKRQDARADTQTKIAGLVNSSTLPPVVKSRLIKQHRDVETFDEAAVKEAIEDAKNEVAALVQPRVRSMGLTGTGAGSSAKAAIVGRAHESVSSIFGGYDPLRPAEASKKNGKNDEENE